MVEKMVEMKSSLHNASSYEEKEFAWDVAGM